ncbi:MAG: DNA-processing protein DprA [Clostridia bacterium]|nr:DNA-processing protein DprA [Clostridia bacterium]
MTTYTKDERALLALCSIDGLEYRHESRLCELVSKPAMLFERDSVVKEYLVKAMGEAKAKTVLMSLTDDYADYCVSQLDKRGVKAVTIFSADYPERLKHIQTPPLVLYCKGNIGLLKSPKTLGIVGSRKTLSYAESFAKDISKTMSGLGVTIVTGSATGADKAAILGAVCNKQIISVIAGGFEHVYPDCNKAIIEDVAKNGLIISEYPPQTPPAFWMFPVRNRIIAGLSQSVLICSGDRKSGARHTAEFALDYGRDLYAFPYSIGIKSGELCNELIKNGAYLCDAIEDLLSAYGIDESQKTENEIIELEDDERVLYQAIKEGADDMTVYCAKNNLKFFEIAPILSELEIKGLIVKTAGNKFKPTK